MSAESFAESTDGIRTVAGEYPLDPSGLYRIGMAVGEAAAELGRSSVVIGEDTRMSSNWMAASVADGVKDAGLIAVRLGVIPTPGTAVVARDLEQMGVQITASHNPYHENGVKPISPEGGKISDELAVWLDNHRAAPYAQGRPGGSIQNGRHWVARYEQFLLGPEQEGSTDRLLKGAVIVTDAANGAASEFAGRIFSKSNGRGLGADVIELSRSPNGRNINDNCGATHMEPLQQAVVQYSAEAGFAFDGDADRVMAVDEHGRVLNGDHLLGILAMTDPDCKVVVGTIMSNMGLEVELHKRDVRLHRTQVGDRHVVRGMNEEDALYGAEQSGHVIIPGLPTGDGMRTAIEIMKRCRATGRSLADFYDDLPMFPQELIEIPVSDKQVIEHPLVQDVVAEFQELIGSDGRYNFRASGTQNVLRYMIEAPNASELISEAQIKLSRAVEQASA